MRTFAGRKVAWASCPGIAGGRAKSFLSPSLNCWREFLRSFANGISPDFMRRRVRHGQDARATFHVFFSAVFFLSVATAAEKPNVIVIMADDQGSIDLGSYGATDLATPHTDALAARGVRFTQFYSAAPVCSPSRAGLLTGRWPVRAGVPGNCASQQGGKGALPPSEITLAEMFKSAGYATAHIGKWHIGYTPDTLPLAQGFDHSFGHMG